MPVEIKELIIKTTVVEGEGSKKENTQSKANDTSDKKLKSLLEQLKTEIINECNSLIEDKLNKLNDR